MFRTSFYLKAASARKEDSIDTVHLSNDSQDDKLSNGASFIAIVILRVLENIFEICPFKRTNLNSVGLGGLNRRKIVFIRTSVTRKQVIQVRIPVGLLPSHTQSTCELGVNNLYPCIIVHADT